MKEIIMLFSGYVFAVLFLFVFFLMVTAILSAFKKNKLVNFEPDISIIIPCYNEEKNIKDCILSIFSSDYPSEKIKLIVVDDGSTDYTIEVVNSLKKRYANLVLIKGDHKGKSESLNKGIKKASDKFILTLDADSIVEKDALHKIIMPLQNKKIGAANGSCIVKNKRSLAGMFQNIEYPYNNLIRKSFSALFNNGIWFFGAFACYRKDVIEKIGYFKKDTLTEDMDIALEIYSAGYKVTNVYDAIYHTIVPDSFLTLSRQRTRWWLGTLQALKKNKKLFSSRSDPSIIFLFLNQYWWSFFAVVSLPLILYQFNYWLPYNTQSAYQIFIYTFRWFSLLGSINVIYMIPEWGISVYSIFGVLSGLISAALITRSLYLFKDKLTLRNVFAIFFYFPYTIVLNIIISISLLKAIFLKKRYFIS